MTVSSIFYNVLDKVINRQLEYWNVISNFQHITEHTGSFHFIRI
jgi:hypothetical protein